MNGISDKNDELEKACRLVENACRSIGRDCQVMFLDDGVSLAPTNWAGDSWGDTLFDAIQDARMA